MTTTTRLRTIFQIASDFALGLALFALVSSFLSVSSGQAYFDPSDPGTWATTVSANVETAAAFWHPFAHEAATTLLAITFAGLTAFNLSIARHLRSVASATHSRRSPNLS